MRMPVSPGPMPTAFANWEAGYSPIIRTGSGIHPLDARGTGVGESGRHINPGGAVRTGPYEKGIGRPRAGVLPTVTRRLEPRICQVAIFGQSRRAEFLFTDSLIHLRELANVSEDDEKGER